MAIANQIGPDQFPAVGASTTAAIATAMGPGGIASVTPATTGAMMDGLANRQIESFASTLQQATLQALEADYLGIGVVDFNQVATAVTDVGTAFAANPDAVGLSPPTTKSFALSFFQAGDLFLGSSTNGG